MSTSQVSEAWSRLERWLALKAPLTQASLRAGADPAQVADSPGQLGLTVPDDLVASLERHDGCEWTRGHFGLAGPFRPVALADLAQRHQETEVVLAEFEGYWDRHLLMFATTNSDWSLVVDCAPSDEHGRVGVWFGGEGVSWTEWPSIGALLSAVADALEQGRPVNGWYPVAFGGELDWKLGAAPAAPVPQSVLALAAAATEPEPEPPLAGIRMSVLASAAARERGAPRPQHGPRPTHAGWAEEYSNLSCLTFVEGIGPEELLRRFGVAAPEVPVRREAAPLTAAEARAAEHIMELVAGPPRRAARFVLAERQDPGWPDRFAADLGPVDTQTATAEGTATREAREDSQAHIGGAGYQVPIWPAGSTSWTAPRLPGSGPQRRRGIGM